MNRGNIIRRTMLTVINTAGFFVFPAIVHASGGDNKNGLINAVLIIFAVGAVAFAVIAAVAIAVSIRRKKHMVSLAEKESLSSFIRDYKDILVIEFDSATKKRVYVDERISQNFGGSYDNNKQKIEDIWRKCGIINKEDYEPLCEYMDSVVKKSPENIGPKRDTHYIKLKNLDEVEAWYRAEASFAENYMNGKDRVIVSLTNVDDDIKQRESLRNQAEYDSVAGIYNKNTFFKRTQELLAESEREYTLVRWDIDRFKVFNDLFGVETGDWLLRTIGEELKRDIQQGSTYGYLGSDHFAMCIPSDELDVTAMINNLCVFLRSLPYNFSIQPRFGFYEIKDRSLSIEIMCDRVLLALRSIKGSYQKRYAFYDERLRREMLFEQQIVNEMSTALEEKQFQIYLQPQYKHSTGKIVSAEALVRWTHPTLGSIPPSRFIPLFEKNGFISQMDRYVWEEACKCMRRWMTEKKHSVSLSVSVNISRMDIYDTELCNTLEDMVRRYGIPPSMLKLEITESAYVENPVQLIDVVNKLKKRGFIIQMDDFGSGYSSLNTLKDVPVDVIKLDLKFLSGDDNSGKGGTILNSVVRMAQWLNLEVIAEGVETIKQANYLQSIGCDLVQGYLYSKPVTIDEFEKMLESESADTKSEWTGMDVIIDSNEFWNPNAQISLIFQSFLNGAAIIEQSGGQFECTRRNTQFCEVADINEETFKEYSTRLMDLVYSDDKEKIRDFFAEAAKTQTETVCECRFLAPKHPERGIRYLRLHTRLIARSETRNVFYLAIDNVTREEQQQRINAEQAEALKKHAQFIQTVYSSVPYGVAQFTCTDKPICVDCNEACFKFSGYANAEEFKESIATENGDNVAIPEDQYIVDEACARCLETGEQQELSFRIKTLNGDTRFIRAILSIIVMPDETKYFQFVYADVTEQVLAEQERSTNQYSYLLLSVFDDINEVNLYDDTITYISTRKSRDTVATQHGLAKVFERWAKSNIHPDDGERYLAFIAPENLKKCFEKKGDYNFPNLEIRYKEGDEDYHWVSITVMNIEDGVYLFCSMDIEERKRAMEYYGERESIEARRREQERYQIIIEETDTIVVEWDFASHAFYHSDALDKFDLVVKPGEEISSKSFLRCVHPDDLSEAREFFRAYREGGKKHSEKTVRIRLKNGEYNWCKVTGTFVYDEKGKPSRALGTITNVHDEVETKKSLEETTESMNNLVKNLSIGFAIVKIKNERITPVFISDKACELIGTTRKKFTGIENFEVKSKEEKQFVESLIKSTKHKKRMDITFRYPLENGGFIWLRAVGSSTKDDDGGYTSYIAVDDVTEKVMYEQDERWRDEKYKLLAQMTDAVAFDYEPRTDTLTYSLFSKKHGYIERSIKNYSEVMLRTNMIHPDYKEAVYRELMRASKKESNVTLEFIANNYGTGYYWRRAHCISIPGEDGSIYKVVGNIENIQREKEIQTEATEGKLYRRAITANTVAVAEFNLTNGDFDIVSMDQRLAPEFYGFPNYFLWETQKDYIHPDDYASNAGRINKQALSVSFRSGVVNYSLQYRIKKRDGSYVWVSTKIHLTSAVNEKEIKGIAYTRIIDDIKKNEAELRQRAERDAVTGLFNRGTTEERIENAISDASTSSVVVVLDVDNFKGLNDAYGHPTGDKILRLVSDAIQTSCRKSDIVGRLGGDEFVAYLHGAKLEEARLTVDRIFSKVREEAEEFSSGVAVTLSGGMTVTDPDRDMHFKEVYERADRALYKAKGNGKNQYCVE